MNLREGTILQGGKYQYRIVKELGQGTFGVTYLATTKVKVVGALGELETTMQVAIKEFFMRDINGRKENTVTCDSQSGVYEDYKRKFAREAQNLCRLHHPHIVRVLEQFEANNTYYYVMEYCEGGSLDALIISRGRIDEKNSIGYLRQIGEALAYMHGQKMLHLDLKPGNIMLRNDTDAVLIDFGLAKQYNAEGEAETSTTVGLGTPGYAPIEQADWKGKGFPVTMDVYAMGATLYKMLVGVRPPDASHIVNNPNSLVEELTQQGVSRQLAVVISKAMAPLVKDRYPNVEQMLAALDGDNTMMEAKRNAPKEEATSLVIDEEKGDVHAIEQAKQKAMNALRIIERDFEAACANIDRVIARKGGGVDEFYRLNNIRVLLLPLRHEIYRWNERYGKISPDLAARSRDLERRWMDKEHVIYKNERSAKERLENVSMVPTGNWNGHDYVDLGLSVMWATHDVEAKSSQDYGWRYAWGEHFTKPPFTLEAYSWKKAYRTGLLKLKKKWKCMEIGSNISGDRFYDAAAFMWRAGWRMPTREEWQELIEKCMWFEKKDGGHEGWVVIGPNGNGIFLPISKEDRCYWSANSAKETNDAYVCGVSDSDVKRFCIYYAKRFSGHRVRPVINKQSVLMTAQLDNALGTDYYYGRNGQVKNYAEAVKYFRKAADQGNAGAQNNLGVCYENGQGVAQDYGEAVKWYRKAADQGIAGAQNNLGVCYENGRGVAQDYGEAVKWYRKAADQGDAEAQYNLGYCYKNGRGVAQDYGEAVKWYRKAADQGNAGAQNNLGVCYKNGQGVAQDYGEAVKWYRKAADQGDAYAQNNLGNCYENGQGVAQDYGEAVKWYRKAADQGNAGAQYNLGVCYKNGQGVAQDYGEAVKWYRKAADQGNAYAQNNLGYCYENGRGVAQDYGEAVKWYRKAANQGNAGAQNNLGNCYEYGRGVAQDYGEAVKWYRKAADQGDAYAQNNLGNCYKNGRGVAQDYGEAVKWYRKAADQGNAYAQKNLGVCYALGLGVSQDNAEAAKWYRKAANQGHVAAQQLMIKVKE